LAPRPGRLITFGAGTNQLASQKVLADRMPEIEKNPVVRAVWAILGAAGLSLWLYWNAITVSHILWGVSVVVLFFLIQRLIWWVKNIFFRIILFAPLVGLVFLKNKFDLPITSIGWLLFTLFFIFGSIRFILSPEGKKIVQAPVSRPLGLRRWVDLYASADPVPNGRTRTTEGRHESKRIWNLGSLLADHTAYWSNRDGFVLRVARVCAETAESPWKHELPDDSDFVDKRAAWRVRFLRLARWISGLTWLVLGVLLWNRHEANVPVPINLPSWVPAQPVQHALFVVVIALAMWATSGA
jgi:hypothetical protein